MKKKVIIGLLFVVIFFTAGGVFLTNSFSNIIVTLQDIILLQQMEIKKKTFLNNIETVQANLLLKDTHHAADINIFMLNVEGMKDELQQCESCHHSTKMTERIKKLQKDTENYLHGLSRVFTLKTDRLRMLLELDSTFAQGNRLIKEVRNIIVASSETVSEEASLAKISISHTKKILILLVTAGPLLLIISTFFFIKGCTRSLSILTNATRKIKAGKLHYRIKEELKDEFGELALSFNEMAVSLQEQYNKLQETERLAVVGELSAGMAHEIKNPLAGIKVSIEVMSQDLVLDQEDKEVFLQIINEIDRINALLKSLLNYARPPKPESVSFDFHQVLDATIKTAQYSLKSPSGDNEEQQKEIEFVKDFSPEVPEIVADPGQMQQVFLNLILNSVDAIAKRGTIVIKTRKSSDETIQIAISDSGKGIDSQSLENIFKPFFTTKSHGTGLGLAICKRLIEQHNGGIISVSNNPEGTGVTFTITLPIQPESEGSKQ